MQFTAQLERFEDNPLWGHHITVPDAIAQAFISEKQSRVVCSLNAVHEFQCALMSKGDGSYFIMLNSEIRKKMQLEIGSILEISLAKDESKYGLPMPEEFQELLYQDELADRFFHGLTKGKQRSLLHIIGKPKSETKRLEKAIVVAEYLKANDGKLDFKALNEAFKNYKPLL